MKMIAIILMAATFNASATSAEDAHRQAVTVCANASQRIVNALDNIGYAQTMKMIVSSNDPKEREINQMMAAMLEAATIRYARTSQEEMAYKVCMNRLAGR